MDSKFENNLKDLQWYFTDTYLEVTEMRPRTCRQSRIPYSAILYFSTLTNREENRGDSTVTIFLTNGNELDITFSPSSLQADSVIHVREILEGVIQSDKT